MHQGHEFCVLRGGKSPAYEIVWMKLKLGLSRYLHSVYGLLHKYG